MLFANFRRGSTIEEYRSIPVKDDSTFYIVEEDGKIFKGDFDITKSFQVTDDYDNLTVENTLPGNFYFDPLTCKVKVRYVYNGEGRIKEIFPGTITTGDASETFSEESLTTVSYVKREINKSISNVLNLEEVEEISSSNKVVVIEGDKLRNSGYSLGTGEATEDYSDKVLATEAMAKDVAESEAGKVKSVWSVF